MDFDLVENPSSLWSRTLGMAKELLNQPCRQFSTDKIEATGKDYALHVPGEMAPPSAQGTGVRRTPPPGGWYSSAASEPG